jgi:hypothetical protein
MPSNPFSHDLEWDKFRKKICAEFLYDFISVFMIYLTMLSVAELIMALNGRMIREQ